MLINSLMPLNTAAKNAKNMLPAMPAMPAMPAVPGWIRILIFVILLGVFITLMVVYKNEIQDSWNRTTETINGYFNPPAPAPAPAAPAVPAPAAPAVPVPDASEPAGPTQESHLISKILPGGEVFSVSSNKFTYNDAEPLCKALGAELATYEQVKEAWGKGADWCNYGWVKGQMAVYPTQKDTWEKAQAGPEDQRMSCGNPGLNGGFFDNPELRFGVTCYGQKPAQSKHDEERVAAIPKSPATLLFDKKVAEFRSQADVLGILPFNSGKWASS